MFENDFEEPGGENSSKDFLLEQRSTERLINDIRVSGYRDGKQEYIENEQLIQLGFDNSYKLFVKIAFLIGEVRSLSAQIVKDSCFLAKLNQKLEKIEQFPYESKLDWSSDKSETLNLKPCFDLVNDIVKNFETKLKEIRNFLIKDFNLKNLHDSLNNLDVIEEHNREQDDQDIASNEKVNLLNNLVESWNF